MKLCGLQIPDFSFPGVPAQRLFERIVQIATTAEESGFDSIWVMDHFWQIPFLAPRTEPMLEAYTLLGGIASLTSRVRLGALVTGVTYRNPALLAKMVTTLDVLCGGRAILGIGAAWFAEEHQGYGFEFPPLGERMNRLEEALQVCRAMFTREAPSFEGRYYRIREAVNVPRPVQAGGPRILVGGNGERRTLRLAARYGDLCNLIGGDPEFIRHKVEVLARHCREEGRDPADIVKTRLGTLVIAPTAEEADSKGRELRRVRGMDEERFRSEVICGSPQQVAERVRAYLDAGLDGMIFNFPDAYKLDSVALAGETLARGFS